MIGDWGLKTVTGKGSEWDAQVDMRTGDRKFFLGGHPRMRFGLFPGIYQFPLLNQAEFIHSTCKNTAFITSDPKILQYLRGCD